MMRLVETAKQLLSLSPQVESSARMSAPEALQLLNGLEQITRDSLRSHLSPHAGHVSAPAQSPQIPNKLLEARRQMGLKPTPASASSAARNAARYETTKKEYQPALKDPTIIEALLAYRGKSPPPLAQPPKSPEGFEPAEIPAVEAEPKTSLFKKTPGIFHPILRSNGP